MSSPPPLSIIIPAHNAAETLATCLNAVLASTISVQVIVVDDGSTDATAQVAAQIFSPGSSGGVPAWVADMCCRVITLETNRGAAAARNVGAAAAEGPILFFLDSDIVMPRDTARHILAEFDRDPALAALFGSYQKETIPQNFFSVYKNLLHHYTHQKSNEQAATFCGGYGAIRRNVFFALGGFDESYFALEDIELGYRLHRAGHPIRLIKALQFTHLKKYTLSGLIRSDLLNRAVPWTRLMLDKHIFRNDLNTKSNNVISVLVSFLLLGSLFWVWFIPFGLGFAAALGILFVLLNLEFLTFVVRERGGWFGLQTAFMTWFNYIYSGVGVLLGVGLFVWFRLQRGQA